MIENICGLRMPEREADGGDDQLHRAARVHRHGDRQPPPRSAARPRRAERAADQLADARHREHDAQHAAAAQRPQVDLAGRRCRRRPAPAPRTRTTPGVHGLGLRSRGTWRKTVPAMNAPNTAWIADPLGRRRAQEGVTISISTRSASGVLKRRVAIGIGSATTDRRRRPSRPGSRQVARSSTAASRCCTAPCDAGAGDHRQDQPADGVVDHAGRQDDQADVALGQIEVHQDLGDHRHRRDRHRGRQKQAEQHPAGRDARGTRPA